MEKQRKQLFSIGPDEEREEQSQDFNTYKLSMLKTTLQHYDSMNKLNIFPISTTDISQIFLKTYWFNGYELPVSNLSFLQL